MISLIYGKGIGLFNPKAKMGDDDYNLQVLIRQFAIFAPFPDKLLELANPTANSILLGLREAMPREDITLFSRIT